MTTKAVRLHGANDLRLDEVDLPPLRDDEILARVVSDSICMSSWKLAHQGQKHKRVRYDLATTPIMLGHEFCGELVEVGARWKDRFHAGQRFAIQPALNKDGTPWAPGYSYPYTGGDSQYIILPPEVMELDCLIPYESPAFYLGSLSEPVSCVIGGFHSQYHSKPGSYVHEMGIVAGGSLVLVAGVGPMGLGAIDYAVHGPRRPGRLIVTGTNPERLGRAQSLLTVEDARAHGVELTYVNTKDHTDPVAVLRALNQGRLFDDVFVFAPVRDLVEFGAALLGRDGCLNFFAGPGDTSFSATLNFYGVHYENHHVAANSGGNNDDLHEALDLMKAGTLNPTIMVTHVGGLNAVAETTLHLDTIPGGKKLMYVQKRLDLVALEDFAGRGRTDPLYRGLAEITARHQGLWNPEAEAYLLAHAPDLDGAP